MKEPEGNPYTRDPDLEFRPVDEIDRDEAETRVEMLREAVDYHDYLYYVENDPVISDRAYDSLYRRLEKLEEEFGLGDPNSPTHRVGGEPVEELETVEHTAEMLSLDSSEEEKEVREFDERVRSETGKTTYSMEPKFDGLSVEFVYMDGELERAVTRGNGREGDDITENVRTIRTVPLRLSSSPDLLAVRGEIFMPREGFQQLNEKRIREGKEPFANPRNAAAGTVRQLDPSVVAERPLDVYFYDILSTSLDIGSQRSVFKAMERLGLKVNQYNRFGESIEEFIEYRNEMMERREDLEYGIDGVTAKVNKFEKREELGETSAHPRWAFAYKFPARTEETTVQRVTVQVGRTGKLTPVALLEPVDVKGVTISRASLHNEKQAQKLGVGEGAEVKVERAGDVIPQIKEVTEEPDEAFKMPSKCPVCGSRVVGEEEHHYCPGGISCPAQLKRKMEHFTSEEAMDIEGLGEKVAEQLVDKGVVEDVSDLYRVDKEDLIGLERFSDRSAEKLLEEIDESREAGLDRFLTALGINHVGPETARLLARNFDLQELREADQEELEQVEDIGPETAENIYKFFRGKGGATVEKLIEAGVNPSSISGGEELEGLKLAITGSIEGYTRQELKERLEREGGDVTSSVTGETDYLVVGENPGETKMEEAEEHGVEKLGRRDFREKILSRISTGTNP